MDTSRVRRTGARPLVSAWLSVLALAAGIASGGGISVARSPQLAVRAQLSAVSVRPGDTLTIDVGTEMGAHILLHVTYPGGGGFKKKGTADSSGHWAHSWQVNAKGTGSASAQLLVQSGSQHRYYTLTFTVLPPPTPTPTPTSVNATPTTPTPTSTPQQPASFFIRGLRIQLSSSELFFDPKAPPLKQVQIGQSLRFSLYSFVTFSPANPQWHSHFDLYRDGKAIAHRDLHPTVKKQVQNHYYVDVWKYTPNLPGTYKLAATLTLTGITRSASASVTVTPPYRPELHLSAANLHVGQKVAVWITSPYWPATARVTVNLVSPDHTFKGEAAWKASCSCLGVVVPLAKKIHGPQIVHVTVSVLSAGKTTWLIGQLTVTGLQPPASADVSPDPITYGDTATITGTSIPGASCVPHVVYSTGESATDLSPKPQTVGKSGTLTWTWKMLSKGTSGAASITCTYHGAKATGSTVFSIA